MRQTDTKEIADHARRKYNEVKELGNRFPHHMDLVDETRAFWYGVVEAIEALEANRLPSVPMIMPDSFTIDE